MSLYFLLKSLVTLIENKQVFSIGFIEIRLVFKKTFLENNFLSFLAKINIHHIDHR